MGGAEQAVDDGMTYGTFHTIHIDRGHRLEHEIDEFIYFSNEPSHKKALVYVD